MTPAEVLRKAAEFAASGRPKFSMERVRAEAKIYYSSNEFKYLEGLITDCGYYDTANTGEEIIALLFAAHLAEEEQWQTFLTH